MVLILPLLMALAFSACGGQGGGTNDGDPALAAVVDGASGAEAPGGSSVSDPTRSPLDIRRIGYDQGSPEAPIKVVEISDFGCGYCRVFNQEIFPTLKKEFIDTGLVEWKFVPFVLGMFPNGDKAAEAGECAGAQGHDAFLRMRNRLFADQAGWKSSQDPNAFFTQLAREEGLEEGPFVQCLENAERDPQVQLNIRLGKALGTQGTPAFVVDGLSVSGALPVDNFRRIFELVRAESDGPSRNWLPQPPTLGRPSIQSQVLGMGIGYGVGPVDAPIQVIEFSDFGCGYCRLFQEQTRPVLDEEYVATGKVRWTYVPFVLGSFPNGDAAALAGECAGEQGKFDVIRRRLYRDQQGWRSSPQPGPFLVQLAQEEGLDGRRFADCMAGPAAVARVQENTRVGRIGGVRGTPAFFVNGFSVAGAQPLETFRDILDLRLSALGEEAGSR